MNAIIQLNDVTKSYRSTVVTHAVQRCSLTIHRGDFVAIVGPSGSGKSTLLNLIGLLDVPDSGTYLLDGVEVAGATDRQRTAMRAQHIGFVFQHFQLLEQRTCLENVMLADLYRGTPAHVSASNAADALTKVGLGERLESRVVELSGGQRQRVAIARALSASPSILLCDEPTGNLDTRTTAEIMALFHAIHQSGVTIMLITHNDDIARQATRIVSIVDGVLTELPGSQPAPRSVASA